MNNSIEHELAACREAAEEGYKLAADKYNEIKDTLLKESHKLSQTDAEQNEIKRIQNTELVETQRRDLERLVERVKLIRDDLKILHERTKDFSIVVYGRTMAGKSTLMEILTHGNGQTIGKGAQRTTRDVRDYFWNGLKITDVPGICAFDGAQDEQLALEAAKSADLILFLLTSDAPQPDEAACLAQLKSFGKPILGVLNVKMSFNINDDLDVEDLRDKLADRAPLDAVIAQFKEFAASHNQDWSGIKFVATHLLSAYQSQDKNPAVFELSRFAEVENFILEKVQSDGRFLRIKTFADSVAVPMSNIVLRIYDHSATTLLESGLWLEKRQHLLKWREKFLSRSQERLDNLHKALSENLDTVIYSFAEHHYNDDKVNEHWQQRLQGLKFDDKYRELLKDFADECERKRKELSDELTQELSVNFGGKTSTNIELEGTTPWGKVAALVLPNLLLLVPGIGWGARIAIGVGAALFSFLFENKSDKIRKAKAKLREDLTAPSHEMLDKMHGQVVEIFNNELLAKAVDEFVNLLANYQLMLARLGKSQSNISAKLFDEFSDLNAKLFAEAVTYKGAGFISSVDKIARVPGELMVAFADRAKLNLDELGELLGEKVIVMNANEKIRASVKNLLHTDFDIDTYPLDADGKKLVAAVFPKGSVDATNFKIAQQIAGLPIVINGFSTRAKSLPTVNARPTTSINTRTTQSSDYFSAELKRVDSFIDDTTVDDKIIADILDAVEQRATEEWDDEILNLVAHYRDKLRNR